LLSGRFLCESVAERRRRTDARISWRCTKATLFLLFFTQTHTRKGQKRNREAEIEERCVSGWLAFACLLERDEGQGKCRKEFPKFEFSLFLSAAVQHVNERGMSQLRVVIDQDENRD